LLAAYGRENIQCAHNAEIARVVSRIARLTLVTLIAAFEARAEDLRGPQKPDGGTPFGRRADDTSSQGASDGEKPKASATFEEVTNAPEAPPPAPEGEERRAIGESVRKHNEDVVRCYNALSEPGKKGSTRLIARFDIGPNGKVIGASADGVSDTQLVACVVTILRKLSFEKPRSGGKLRVAYPFLFASSDSPR
jgi:hypothetical protein